MIVVRPRLRFGIEKVRGFAKMIVMTRHCMFAVVSAVLLFSAPAQADLIGHGGMVRSIDVSPDGRTVITGSFDFTARLWDFGDQSEVAVLDAHEGPVTSVRFSPDSKLAVSTSDDMTAIVWDVASRQQRYKLKGHAHKVMTSAFSVDGKKLATGSWDKTVKLWSLETGELLQTITAKAPVNAVVFFDGDQKIAVGGHLPLIEVFDLASGDPDGKFDGHKMGITALRVSPDGKALMSASIDKSVKFWNLEKREEINSIEVRNTQVYDAAYSSDGKRIVTASKDGYVVEWDLESMAPVHEIHAHDRIAWAVAYAPGGQFAVSASSDEQARVWHMETGDRIGLVSTPVGEPQPWLESDHPGAKLYPKCARCHALTADGPSRSGPHFANLFGRKVGSVSGYHYSDALKSADFEWNDETLFRLFDIGPDKMLPGTKMPVQRVTDDAQLTALVDYLKVLTGKAQE